MLFSPNGQRLLASFDKGSIFVWTADGHEITHLSMDKHDVTDFTVPFDGAWIAAGDSAGYLTVWEATSWQTLARVHANTGVAG